jgi:hypothetical protein
MDTYHDKMLKRMNFASHKWAEKIVNDMTMQEINTKLKNRQQDINKSSTQMKKSLKIILAEEKFIITASDIFLWSRKDIDILACDVNLKENDNFKSLLKNYTDEGKKMLVYAIVSTIVSKKIKYKIIYQKKSKKIQLI